MRTPFMAGNWKMNLTAAEARDLARDLVNSCGQLEGIDMAVAPPATALSAVLGVLKGSRIEVAAQNCHWEAFGAYTGEISAEMIREIGCRYVIIGHSERRQFFGETDESVNRRLHAAHRASLHPIVCIGESLKQREAGQTMEVVAAQLKGGLKDLPEDRMRNTTIAYEPVWAIGTGKTATPGQAQEVHACLRGVLRELYGSGVAEVVRIQYGGSVKPSNVKELMAMEDIDGALVGGASLKADSFRGILNYRS
jgi:triosephosphate isomerase